MKTLITVICLVMVCSVMYADTQQYTSLVIDATALELERSMSPKVLSEKGYEVYGTIFKNLDKAMEIGVVMYAPDLKTVKKYAPKRLGKNPLIVNGKGVKGVTHSSVTISDSDARKVLKENKKYKFLEKFNVIILISPPKQ